MTRIEKNKPLQHKRAPVEIHSILETHLDYIKSHIYSEFNTTKDFIYKTIRDSKISQEDKERMILALNNKHTPEKVLFYVYDSVLAYKGLRTI